MENNSLRVTHTNSFGESNQNFLSQPALQDINGKILHFIDQIGEMIVKNLQVYQVQEIEQYKNDLLKTQQQFYKLRNERDQQSIKANIINEKRQMQIKFNQKMKASQKGTNLYEQMKIQLKDMTQKQKQLKKQIQYMKKQIKKANCQGQSLEEQLKILALQNQTNQRQRLFFDKSNTIQKKKFEQTNLSDKAFKQKQQARIQSKIQQIKDYMKQIPDQLNFFQTKIASIIASQGGIVRQKFKRTYLQQILAEQQSKRYIYQQYLQHQDQKKASPSK